MTSLTGSESHHGGLTSSRGVHLPTTATSTPGCSSSSFADAFGSSATLTGPAAGLDSSSGSGSHSASGANFGKQVIVGICAMEKKSLSKPMKEILTRIEEFEYIKTVIFPEDVILNVR